MAGKKAGRVTSQGLIGSYIHAGAQLGVMVEINCESDFVARTDVFKELVHDVAMHIAAADPKYLRREDVPAAILDKEKEIASERARAEGKPEKIIDRIVEGQLTKFYEASVLLDQPFVKEEKKRIKDLLAEAGKAVGATLTISRFARFKVGEA